MAEPFSSSINKIRTGAPLGGGLSDRVIHCNTANPLIRHGLPPPHHIVLHRPTKRITMFTVQFQQLDRQPHPRTAVYGLPIYQHSNTTHAACRLWSLLTMVRAFWRRPGRTAKAQRHPWHPDINRTTPPVLPSPAGRWVTWVPKPGAFGCRGTQRNPLNRRGNSSQHPCVRCITFSARRP